MKNKEKMNKFRCTLVAIAVVLSSIIVLCNSTRDLEIVKKVIVYEDFLYGIDERQDSICFFRSDSNGENASISTVATKNKEKNTVYQLDDFEIVQEGIFKLWGEEIQNAGNYSRKQYTILYDMNQDVFYEKKEVMEQENLKYYLEEVIDGNLWYVDNMGNVVKYKNDKVPSVIFMNDGTTISKENMAHIFTEEGVSFYNVSSGKQYLIEYDTGELKEKPFDHVKGDLKELGNLAYLYEMPNGVITASFYTDDGKTLPAVFEEDFRLIEKLSISQTKKLVAIILLSLLLMLLIKIYNIIINRFNGIFPTTLKLIILSIPLLFMVFIVISEEMENLHQESLERQSIVNIQTLSKLFHAESIKKNFATMELELEKIKGLHEQNKQLKKYKAVNYEEETYELENYESTNKETANNELEKYEIVNYELEEEGMKTSYSLASYNLDLFQFKNSRFYKIDSTMLYCAPMKNSYKKEEIEALEMVIEHRMPVHLDTTYGKSLDSYFPVINEYNRIVAIIKTSLPHNRIAENHLIKEVTIDIAKFMITMILIMLVLVYVLLKPLGKLRLAIMSNNDKGLTNKWGRYSEVGNLKEIFEELLFGIQTKLEEVSILNRSYDPFIPKELIALFHEKNISEISLGDNVRIKTTILMIDSNNFTRIASKTSSFKTFQFVNEMFKESTKSVYEEGGVVSEFKGVSMMALFKDDIGGAVSSGSKALEILAQVPRKLGNGNVIFGGCVVETEIHLGIIGSEERMEVLILSKGLKLLNHLKKISAEFQTGILIDEETAKKVDGYIGGETVRKFGFFQIEDIGEKLIYEDFSRQGEVQIRLKKMTKKDFELGVKMMMKKDYSKARTYFVKVIKKNRDDIVSFKHFQSCNDAIYLMEKGENNESPKR